MIKFRQKNFGLSDSIKHVFGRMGTGAAIGAGMSSIPGSIVGFHKKFHKGEVPEFAKKTGLENPADAFVASTLIGAALGLFVGTFEEISKAINRKHTVDRRLMDGVISILKKTGYKEGEQFTRDPKDATRRKIKVCITIFKESGEVRIGVNTVADPKLRNILENKIRTYQNAAVENIKTSDKFNEITISAVSDGSADAGFVAGIADSYIHAGYPVYLVEVG